jgi:hypothetical protein
MLNRFLTWKRDLGIFTRHMLIAEVGIDPAVELHTLLPQTSRFRQLQRVLSPSNSSYYYPSRCISSLSRILSISYQNTTLLTS